MDEPIIPGSYEVLEEAPPLVVGSSGRALWDRVGPGGFLLGF